jgi:hypothetical protein
VNRGWVSSQRPQFSKPAAKRCSHPPASNVDYYSRAGEGLTVRESSERCEACGARMTEVLDAYTLEVKSTRCRGGCSS